MRLSRLLTLTGRYARDAEAVQRGRIGQRITNRMIGRAIGRATRGWWR